MTQFWTETINRLQPYVPGEQRRGAQIVKLNTNENPYPPSPSVIRAIHQISGDALRRYPDPGSEELRRALADYHGLSKEQVFVGNGSDEILALTFLAYFSNGKPLQMPDISYSFYPVYCDLYEITRRSVPLESDYSLDIERFKANLGGIVFPNPNAPTGRDIPINQIVHLLQRHNQEIMLIDEAYTDLGAESAVSLINEFPNLLVSHTFSKGRSLAGLRLGVAFGDKSLIEGLQRVKDSFNSYPVDVIAQAAGIASISDEEYYRQILSKLIETRQQLARALSDRGFNVLPSTANFVLAQTDPVTAVRTFKKLGAAGVLVRYWDKPRLSGSLRISIGTPADIKALLDCLDA